MSDIDLLEKWCGAIDARIIAATEDNIQCCALKEIILSLCKKLEEMELCLREYNLNNSDEEMCFCDVAIGNPMMHGKHSSLCIKTRKILETP